MKFREAMDAHQWAESHANCGYGLTSFTIKKIILD